MDIQVCYCDHRQVIQVYPNVVKSNNAHAVSSSLLESGLTLIINTSFRLTSDIVKWHEKGVNRRCENLLYIEC